MSGVQVYKLGGPALEDPGLLPALVAELRRARGRVLLVHGGGRHVERALEERSLESRFIGGRRETSPEAMEVVEMVLGGFSGRATRLLAHHLQRCAEKLWPPVYVGHGLRIGAYIVKFQLKEKGKADRNLLFADEAPKIDIIPLDTDVIARRMIATGEE